MDLDKLKTQLKDAGLGNLEIMEYLRQLGLEGEMDMMDKMSEAQVYETGGRVGMQEGGETELTEYQKLLADLDAAQKELGADSIAIKQPSPGIEALLRQFGPQLSNLLASPIDQEGLEGVYGSLLPEAAAQNKLQQQAIQQQLNQAGMGTAQFDKDTGAFTGISGTGTGLAGYQPFLQGTFDANTGEGVLGAAQLADRAGKAAVAGQGAGAAGIGQAASMAGLMGAQALAGQDAGAQQLANAQAQADLISQAAAAGQGAGTADFAAARALTGPQAFQQFMSPYQQEVIDATMADYQQQLAEQQAQLGTSAGSAFGGGRFGVAQGQLAAQGTQDMANQLARLRQQGFEQAQQLAAQNVQQRMGLGQAAQQQAAQNLGLFGQALGGQQSQAQQFQQQVAQNLGLYGQAGQAGLAQSAAAQQQAAQNLGLLGQAGQTQAGLASLQPQLAAQQISSLGQLGAAQQKQAQGLLDTFRAGQKQIAYEPYDRMDFFGNQLAKASQGYAGTGASFGMQQQQAPSPFSQVLGGIASIAGPALQTAAAFGYGQPRIG